MTEGGPRASVVVPAHQSAAFIGDTLRRILAQTVRDIEVVVVDNGSTDGTGAVVAGLRDERIRYHWQEDSGLPANSRNVGVGMASGGIVAFCDADDLWYADKLERTLSAFDVDPALALVWHDVRVTLEGRTVKERAYRPDLGDVYGELLYRGNFITTSAVVARKDALERVGLFSEDPALRTVEDYDLWLRLAEAGERFGLVPLALGEWVLHPGSASADLEAHYARMFALLDRHYARLAEEGALRRGAAVRRLLRARLALARDLARGGSTGRALALVARLPLDTGRDLDRYR